MEKSKSYRSKTEREADANEIYLFIAAQTRPVRTRAIMDHFGLTRQQAVFSLSRLKNKGKISVQPYYHGPQYHVGWGVTVREDAETKKMLQFDLGDFNGDSEHREWLLFWRDHRKNRLEAIETAREARQTGLT